MDDAPRAVVVLVGERAAGEVSRALDQHEADLAADGFTVQRHTIAANASPEDVRALLAREHAQASGGLSGALLVGRVPAARANKNAIGRAGGLARLKPPDDYWHDHPCDLYYMDLHST